MNFLSLIETKRDGQGLSGSQIRELVEVYTRGEIPDYQMAAFLMAVYFRGLDAGETRALTLAMRDSGDQLRWPSDRRPVVDKHSTGGVGDKASLPLAPLLACLGFRVPMVSGRGLGITGGTMDKLESIPGFKTALPAPHITEIVQEVGCVICGQTDRMAPADKGLYALRDVTGTVPSIPLIVASILSKKLAEGLDALLLDVKFGSGAFMAGLDQARALASAMVQLGDECGVRTRALITSMHAPLGRAAGNWLEVVESLQCLTPGRTRGIEDLRELVLTCAATLLMQTGKANTEAEAATSAEHCLNSGEPLRRFNAMLAAQGADLEAFQRLLEGGAGAPVVVDVRADASGTVSRCDARRIGEVVRDLGGGRLTRDAVIVPLVGVDRLAKPGETVTAGSVLGRVHARTKADAEAALTRLRSAFQFDTPGLEWGTPSQSLIVETI